MKGVKISLLISPVPLTPPFLHSSITSLSASPSLCVSSSLFMSLSADSLPLCYSLNIPLLLLNTASFRCSSCYQHPPCSLCTSHHIPCGQWEPGKQSYLSDTHKHTRMVLISDPALFPTNQPAIPAMLFDHIDFYMVVHNQTR